MRACSQYIASANALQLNKSQLGPTLGHGVVGIYRSFYFADDLV